MKVFHLSPLALALAAAAMPAAHAQDEGAGALEEVVVTGFRQSLERALDIKRDSANNVETIVAEDMGKMPDLNLAESLQRVPGVAITREGGEGRSITVRGLSPDFTRSTLNGMEVPGSAGGLDSSGGVNRGRSMDFNIFASELFNRIDIHKSPKASVEEGGLASTVELFTAKPFDNPGLNASVSGQFTVDNVADEADPRFAALVSNTFMDDTVGVLFSVAHSTRTVRQEGFGTVRYTSPFANGQSWADTSGTTINGTPDPDTNHPEYTQGDDPLDYMWTPRLPRMDYFGNTQDRTGVTAAFQFRPNDRLELGLDIVGSELSNDRESYNYFAQFRNTFDEITPTSVTLDAAGRQIVAGTFQNVTPRSESRGQFSETTFLQTVFSGKYDLSDRTELSFMLGNANSEHDEEQYRFNLTASEGHDFTFDFGADSDIAEMSYGFDILEPSNYFFSGPTLRKDVVDRDNTTFRLDLETEQGGAVFKTGFIYNDREVDSLRYNPTEGTIDAPDEVTSDLATSLTGIGIDDFASGLDAPGGFPRDFLIAHFDNTIEAYGAGQFTPVPVDASSWNVQEETMGLYGEVDFETSVFDRPFRVNTGLRIARTFMTSSGATEDPVTGEAILLSEDNAYTDVLPSTNIVWEIEEDLLLRANISRNITRPGLGSLSPTVTGVTPINGNISRGNPNLDPMRASAVDLGLEWYFDSEALLAVTLFHKDIESFISGDEVEGPLTPELRQIVSNYPAYDPDSPLFEPNAVDINGSAWFTSQPVNGDGAQLDGVEIAYQQPFTFLPAPFDNLGMIANYTYVSSEANFGSVVSTLPGLSEESYNFTLYYETDRYGIRGSINGRDDYITSPNGSNGNAQEATTGPTRLDMSAFYNITDDLKVTLEGINMTNETERLYTTGPLGDMNLVREYNTTGREVYLGLRYSY
ncbi:TonB-dependent receptor [Marinimicrobium sp. LS-A18]|uniref:TonB-dependent receptor n=1 Tax=Marinimicrobium sp. LS-A18 TaxID=1381596 RepID=UPI000462FFE3|nr:TonB-dependent receptor [Marinimicrobium sp. LS-A18]